MEPRLTDTPTLQIADSDSRTIHPGGAWTVANVETLERLCSNVRQQTLRAIDLGGVTALDTVGAWLFEKLARRGGAQSEASFVGRPNPIPGCCARFGS